MKKITALVLALLLIVAAPLTLASCKKDTEYTVGIIELMEHPALSAATKGFKDALVKEFGDKVKFEEGNAQGDSTACTTIAETLVSKNVDLILGNATPSLLAAYNKTTTIPILGTSVTDYGVALELDDFDGTVGGNVSGTSDFVDPAGYADMIEELFPAATKIAMLYCSAEPNSVFQAELLEEILIERDFDPENIKTFTFADSNDIAAVSASAAAFADVIYVPTDNTAASNAALIKANIGNTPVVAGEEGICTGCGVVTLAIDYYALGYKTGEMAVKILKGEADISEMAVETLTATKLYNTERWAELELGEVPEGYTAIKTAE